MAEAKAREIETNLVPVFTRNQHLEKPDKFVMLFCGNFPYYEPPPLPPAHSGLKWTTRRSYLIAGYNENQKVSQN